MWVLYEQTTKEFQEIKDISVHLLGWIALDTLSWQMFFHGMYTLMLFLLSIAIVISLYYEILKSADTSAYNYQLTTGTLLRDYFQEP